MIESTGPVVRSPGVDPLKTDRWPLACALGWIRAHERQWSVQERDEFICRAYQEDARAYPAGDPPMHEGHLLLDLASTRPDLMVLSYQAGTIATWLLGPDAKVLPTVDQDRHTFAIWLNIDTRILNVWCSAHQVRAAWPSISAKSQTKKTASAYTACTKWLADQMRASPSAKPKSKQEWYVNACAMFGNSLGSASSAKPSRNFERAWQAAMEATGTREVWGRAGAPKKSSRQNRRIN